MRPNTDDVYQAVHEALLITDEEWIEANSFTLTRWNQFILWFEWVTGRQW